MRWSWEPARRLRSLSRWITEVDITDSLDSLYGRSPFLGIPSSTPMRMAYWRKTAPAPADMDPDRDGCGILWCSPALPFEGRSVRGAVRIIEDTSRAFRFEPNIGLNCVTERCIDVTAAILFDRRTPGEDERALECHAAMSARLVAQGYLPYRLGLASMTALPRTEDGYDTLLHALKEALDPNRILAPGRYESP